MTAAEWQRLALVPVILAVGAGLLVVLRRRAGLAGEGLRKAGHLGMGVLALAVPWWFESVVAVWLAVGICGLAFIWARLANSDLGEAFIGVGRRSYGEFFWVLAVGGCFQWRAGTVDYCAAVLVLTLADPAAALVGKRWGAHRNAVLGNHKSLEGSVACFVVAALILVGGSLAGWGLPLWLALGVALAVTLLEAVCSGGLDNLAMPVAVLLLWPG